MQNSHQTNYIPSSGSRNSPVRASAVAAISCGIGETCIWDKTEISTTVITVYSRSTAVPTTMNHVSSQRTRRLSSFQSGLCCISSMISPTTFAVSQGWRYQDGDPNTGWSPCERRGNAASPALTANVVALVCSRMEERKNAVLRMSEIGKGLPSAK